MGIKSRDWEQIGGYISKIKSEGLSYKKGAERYGLNVSDIYEYNKRFKKRPFERGAGKVRNWTKIGEYVSRIEKSGMSYVEGAEHFGISVSSIYKYNSQIKRKNLEESCSKETEPEDGSDGACHSDSLPQDASGLSPLSESESEDSPPVESAASCVSDSAGDVDKAIVVRAGNVNLPPGVADLIVDYRREQTLFARYLDDMKIEHIVADPHSPQTLGKVERFHQTIQRELLDKSHFVSYEQARQRIESYMHHYNYDRPHQGIGGACPASRFQGVIGETSRIESELCGKGIDFSRGYLVFKMFEHTISIVCTGCGLQVFLDGDLLKRSPEVADADRREE